MNECQLRSRNEIETLNMTIADFESKELNSVLEDTRTQTMITESKADISNIKDAKERIQTLLKVVKSKD